MSSYIAKKIYVEMEVYVVESTRCIENVLIGKIRHKNDKIMQKDMFAEQ